MPKKKADKKPKTAASSMTDVSKPGSTPAMPSSRPIIVGHQANFGQDPLLTKKSEDSSPEDNPAEHSSSKQKKISPPEAEETADAEVEVTDEKTDQPQQQNQPDEYSNNTDSNAAIDALAGEVDAKAHSKEKSKADQEAQEKIQTLIDAKRYHLPIIEGGKKGASERIVSWLLIILLIAAAAVWLSIDAGYLDVGIELPYDFIKN